MSDGYHIGLLIMSNLWGIAPEFIREGRLYWLRSPLYIVKNGGKEEYFYTDEEMNAVRNNIKGEIIRAKGLGQLSPKTAKASMFDNQRFEQMEYSEEAIELLEQLMGEEVSYRTDYIFKNIDFSTVRE